MREGSPRRPLVVRVADKDCSQAVRGLLARHRSLGIQNISQQADIYPDTQEKDPGCLLRAHEFLRSFHNAYDHALVIFDHEGSGREDVLTPEQMQKQVENNLQKSGWEDRAAAVVINPELEAWVWSNSPHVSDELDWEGGISALREWLTERQFLGSSDQTKPQRPKEDWRAALREMRKPPSAARFRRLAETVSLRNCEDPAFNKLKATLQRWFPCT